mgnify:CR=1
MFGGSRVEEDEEDRRERELSEAAVRVPDLVPGDRVATEPGGRMAKVMFVGTVPAPMPP